VTRTIAKHHLTEKLQRSGGSDSVEELLREDLNTEKATNNQLRARIALLQKDIELISANLVEVTNQRDALIEAMKLTKQNRRYLDPNARTSSASLLDKGTNTLESLSLQQTMLPQMEPEEGISPPLRMVVSELIQSEREYLARLELLLRVRLSFVLY
jgi:uncharacterized small protein (DUF1192 family)